MSAGAAGPPASPDAERMPLPVFDKAPASIANR